jgi:P-type Cu2+ transporter
MGHTTHGPSSDAHVRHKMSDVHVSHERHAGHSRARFRDKFGLSFALTVPVVFWSTDVQHCLGYTAPWLHGAFLKA